MNSIESDVSLDHSMTLRSHWSLLSKSVESARCSLYFQCAAMPYSAVLCISWVRICTSNACPKGLMTVVCSDW